jgi:hypothetical protein
VVTILMLVPLVLGWMQHDWFVKNRTRSWRGVWHMWMARLLILLGIVDGFLVGPSLIYAAVAGLTLIFYLGFLAVRGCLHLRNAAKERRELRSQTEMGPLGHAEYCSRSLSWLD